MESHAVDILSFDGGGSRGIMEVAIMEDVMKLATILWQTPESLEYLTKSADALKEPDIVKKVVNDLDRVRDPIHPTEVYDMIVGTSTGALIAFGLVGGNVGPNGKRSPMTLRECKEMYLAKTGRIFHKSCAQYLLPSPLSRLVSYSSNNVKEVLKEEFQGCRLRDLKDSKTVAGAVTRQIGHNERLVLFDTRTEIYGAYKIEDVLLASTNAPVYFKTPTKIGGSEFVDGGVGGNCPLVQAVPRAKEISGNKQKPGKVRSALSIAPPAPDEAFTVPNRLQFRYWLNYFIKQSTGGAAVYREAKSRHKSITFRRLEPRGQRLKHFEMDEVDAEEMLIAMEEEKFNNHLFLVDIVATATAVIDTFFAKNKTSADATPEIAARLAHVMGKVYARESEFEMAEDAYNTAMNLRKKLVSAFGNDDEAGKRKTQIEIAHTYDDIGQTWIDQSKLQEAVDLYRASVERWRAIHGDVNDIDIANATYKLAVSYHHSGLYDEAHEHYRRALEMQEQGRWDAEIAATLNDIGECYHVQEKYPKALEYISRALEKIRKLCAGQNDLKLAETTNSLGICLVNLKDFENGEKHITESFEMRKRLLPDEKVHPAIADSLHTLGWCFMLQDQYQDAQQYLQRALQMFKIYYRGKPHCDTAAVLKNIARLKLHQREHNASINYAQQSIAMIKACCGNVDHLIVSQAQNIIGKSLYNKKKTNVAITYSEDAVEMMRRLFGEGFYPTLADAEVDLAMCFMAVAKYDNAKGQLQDAMRIQGEVGGETADILGYIEECNENLGGAAKNVLNNDRSDKLRLLS